MFKYLSRCSLLLFVASLCSMSVHAIEPGDVSLIATNDHVSPYVLTSAEYLAQAEQRPDQHEILLLAAGRLISENQWQQARAILAQTLHLTLQQQEEKKLLLAQIALLSDQPDEAIKTLQDIKKVASFSLYHQIQYHQVLAQAYRATNKINQSLAERIKLETLVDDEQAKTDNRRELWFTLINMPRSELKATTAEAAPQSELQGWLTLATIATQYRTDPKALIAALDEWQMQFNQHPANNLLPNPLDTIVDKMLMPPQKIALLLPLTGPFAGPGNAVQDGFMAAYKAKKEGQDATQVLLYDTGKDDVTRLYDQAIHDGAQYVVGPLIKNQVAALANRFHPVPTLLLNDSAQPQENSYSFGLSPAHEATQVALRASKRGFKRALIFAPANVWGDEVVKAFKSEWVQQGGTVTDIYSYNVNPQIKEDFNKKIRDFLQITESQEREKQIKELLGQTIQVAPSRRQDFDMIFLLAYPSKARQIMPALKYYYTDDVPVYATSSVYSGHGNALKDNDLNGIIFCDLPWVFTHQMSEKNWPEQFNSYNRLYALGMDSYALATQLNQLMLFPAHGTNKTKEVLYLKSNQEIARILAWGQFKDGLAQVFDKIG